MVFMVKGKSTTLLEIEPANRASDTDNEAKITDITFQEQYKYFTDEVSSLLGGAKMEKYWGKDVLDTFPFGRMGFKQPLN